MSEIRKSDPDDLISKSHTYHTAKLFRGLIKNGGLEGAPIDPADSGVFIPTTEQNPPLVSLSDSGTPLHWQGHTTSQQSQQQNISYEARQQEDNQTLRDFGL